MGRAVALPSRRRRAVGRGCLLPGGLPRRLLGRPAVDLHPSHSGVAPGFRRRPQHPQGRGAGVLVRENCRWEHEGQPFFSGEVEPCINGRTVAIGAYFGEDVGGIVERLLGEQLPDGGWNCEAEYGSVRSSFHSTICVLEGLLAHEQATGGSADSVAARRRGEEYLLERRLFRRLSTGV